MISRVERVMTPRVVAVSSSTAVADARAVASANRCRHLLVVDAGSLVGVTCVCELQRSTALERVGARMREPITIRPGDSPADAAAIMRNFRIGCLPVLRGGRVIGVVSRGDLVRVGTLRPVSDEGREGEQEGGDETGHRGPRLGRSGRAPPVGDPDSTPRG